MPNINKDDQIYSRYPYSEYEVIVWELPIHLSHWCLMVVHMLCFSSGHLYDYACVGNAVAARNGEIVDHEEGYAWEVRAHVYGNYFTRSSLAMQSTI